MPASSSERGISAVGACSNAIASTSSLSWDTGASPNSTAVACSAARSPSSPWTIRVVSAASFL